MIRFLNMLYWLRFISWKHFPPKRVSLIDHVAIHIYDRMAYHRFALKHNKNAWRLTYNESSVAIMEETLLQREVQFGVTI